MTPETQDLINLRLTQAADSLKEACVLIDRKMCRGAMDRVYFTMFYCACALLASKEFGGRFERATQLHQDADLGSHAPPDYTRMKELLADAESFLTTTKLFLAK